MKTIVTIALNPAIDKSSSVAHVVAERKPGPRFIVPLEEGKLLSEEDQAAIVETARRVLEQAEEQETRDDEAESEAEQEA